MKIVNKKNYMFSNSRLSKKNIEINPKGMYGQVVFKCVPFKFYDIFFLKLVF